MKETIYFFSSQNGDPTQFGIGANKIKHSHFWKLNFIHRTISLTKSYKFTEIPISLYVSQAHVLLGT
jgi:hypothetical protein